MNHTDARRMTGKRGSLSRDIKTQYQSRKFQPDPVIRFNTEKNTTRGVFDWENGILQSETCFSLSLIIAA